MLRTLLESASVWIVLAQMVWAQGFSPAEAAARMQVPAGFRVDLVASEPDVRQPIFVKFDDRGRLWTIQYLQYPNPAGLKRVSVDRWSRTVYDRVPEPPPHGPQGADKISVLIDQNHDGQIDQVKDVITGLNLCTGLEFGHGGLFVLQVPYLLFYPDRDGDDVPDSEPEVLLDGFGMEDAQSFANHLTWGPDGWLYGVNGSTTTCRIRGLEFQQGVWRYHPVTRDFELFCEGGGNLFGLTFDARGNLIYTGNGGYLAFHALQGAYYLKTFSKHGPLHNPYAYGYFSDLPKQGAVPGAPSTGGTIYFPDATNTDPAQSGFPAEYHGALISGNFLGHSISWWKLAARGATFGASHQGLLADSRDAWCCPTDLCLGPDGAIYWCDFYDQRTAHPDPDANWDVSNGRIYRIVSEQCRRSAPVDLLAASSEQLVDFQRYPGWHAQRARTVLAERRDSRAYPILRRNFRAAMNDIEALQMLWALTVSGGADDDILIEALHHAEPAVRLWGARLAGDRKSASPPVAEQLIRRSASESDLAVRCQLAATARRLTDSTLPMVWNLLETAPQEADRHLTHLIWWALEPQAVAQREKVLKMMTRSTASQHAASQFQLAKLVRRYATEGHQSGYDACHRLLTISGCPDSFRNELCEALRLGLSERSQQVTQIGQGDLLSGFSEVGAPLTATETARLAAISGPLLELIRQRFQEPHDLLIDQLAMLTGDAELHRAYLQQVELLSIDDRMRHLPIIETHGTNDFVPLLLAETSVFSVQGPSVLRVLARLDHPEIVPACLRWYSRLPEPNRRAATELLFRRPAGARALLTEVEAQRIAVSEIPFDLLRMVALHEDDELNAIVRKYWGNLQPGTSEEKLATVRRFKNDLRAAAGHAAAGKALFTKQCGTCHQLFNEGGTVGPNLDPANRGDQEFLLVSIVDPSAVIRSQYLNYVVTTQSGAVLQGVLAEQNDAHIVLVDAMGTRHVVSRSEIDELKESTVSLMPEKLLDALSPQELRDLFAYLQTQSASR